MLTTNVAPESAPCKRVSFEEKKGGGGGYDWRVIVGGVTCLFATPAASASPSTLSERHGHRLLIGTQSPPRQDVNTEMFASATPQLLSPGAKCKRGETLKLAGVSGFFFLNCRDLAVPRRKGRL